MSGAPPRFAADVMLGRTARWLRLLGFDTFYDNQAADADLKKRCLAESRILLTKDVALHQSMPAGSSRLVAAVHPRQQMEELMAVLRLERFALSPRCMVCNGVLAAVEKERVRDLVPHYVYLTQSRFQRCQDCLKIYWQGTHIGKIERFIESIRKVSG